MTPKMRGSKPNIVDDLQPTKVSLYELMIFLAALLAGGWLRCGYINQLAVEHFDEAVYSSNILFDPAEGGQYPYRPLYAPPLLPLTIECLELLWLTCGIAAPHWSPMLPGILCGLVSIIVVWYLARTALGIGWGLIAAWGLALNEFHAYYSRTALTDVPFTLFFLLTVLSFYEGLKRNSYGPFLWAGIIGAIAWCTKHNGWLIMALFSLSAGLLSAWKRMAPQRSMQKIFMGTSLCIGIMILLWLPVLIDAVSAGGYWAVMANHHRYVQPWRDWWRLAWLQFHVHYDYYHGYWSTMGWLLLPSAHGLDSLSAFCFGKYQRSKKTSDLSPSKRDCLILNTKTMTLWMISILFVIFPTLVLNLLLLASLLALPIWIWQTTRDEATKVPFAILLLVWLTIFFILIPHYYPYPRLLVPVIPAFCLTWTWFVWYCTTSCLNKDLPSVPALIISALIWSGLGSIWGQQPRCLEDRTSFLRAAEKVIQFEHSLPRENRYEVYGICAEPALWYHLRRLGLPALLLSDTEALSKLLDQPHDTLALVIGPLAGGTSQTRREIIEFCQRRGWRECLRITTSPLSSLVRWDYAPSGSNYNPAVYDGTYIIMGR